MDYKNIILKNTFKEYNKRYKYHKNLLKFTKKEVEEFDREANTVGEHYLLRNNKWWLIGDTYYQVPKALHHYWFRNLNVGAKTAICLLGAGIVATSATLPFVIKNVKIDESDDVFIDPSKETVAKIEVISKSSAGVIYKVSPKDSSKNKVTGIESVCIGNDMLIKDTEYTYKEFNKTESDSIELTINQVAFSSHSGPIRVLPIVESKEEPETKTIPVLYDDTAIATAGFILSEQGTEIKEEESVSFKLTNNTKTELTFDIVANVNGEEVYRSASSQILADNETQPYSIDSSDIKDFGLLTKEDEIVITVELKTTSIHTDLESSNLFLKPQESKKVKILDNNNQNLTNYCTVGVSSPAHCIATKEGTGEDCEYVITANEDVKGSDKDTITFSYGEVDALECSIDVTYAKTLKLNSVNLPTGITQTGALVEKVIQTDKDISIGLNSTFDEYIAGITIKDTNDNIVFEDYLTIANGESTISLNNSNIEWKNVKEDATYTIYINGKDVSIIRPDCGNKLYLHANDTFSVKILDQNGTNVSKDCEVSYDSEEEKKKLPVTKTDTQFDVTVADSYTIDDSTHLYFTYGNEQIRTSIYIEFIPRELNIKFDDSLNTTLKRHSFAVDTTTSTSLINEANETEIKINYKKIAPLSSSINIHLFIKDHKSGNVIKDYGNVTFYSSTKPVTLKFEAKDYSGTIHNQDIYIHGEDII